MTIPILFRLEECILDRKKADSVGTEGRLPALAPLANPYVPFQIENPPRYDPEKALVRGTLFPGLELPFMGQINKSEKPMTPLTELQTMAFAIQELALYLDTHRDDQEALDLYRNFQKMYQEGQRVYEQMCGPLNHMSPTDGSYKWLDDPWPWEYTKNREVL